MDDHTAPGAAAWRQAPTSAAQRAKAAVREMHARETAALRRWIKVCDRHDAIHAATQQRLDRAAARVVAAMRPLTPATYARAVARHGTRAGWFSKYDPVMLRDVVARVTAAKQREASVTSAVEAQRAHARAARAVATRDLLAVLPHLGEVLGLSGRALAEFTRVPPEAD